MKIPKWLRLSETRDVEQLDDPAATMLHAEIIKKKPFLRQLYFDFYREFEKAVAPTFGKVLIEVGSGAGFIKEVIPDVITSDLLDLPNVDRVFSAVDMPFENESIDAFFMFNVLHHIADPAEFFTEAARCLKHAGKIIMIEPANTLWSRFVYRNFHHEFFDTRADWKLSDTKPLSCANSAIAWIIFSRDREVFEKRFPGLKIIGIQNHTPLRYLLSGGFTLRQLVPSCVYPLVKVLEYALSPFNNLAGMFETVELQKVY
jgi:SAM-dependent methyltransferase